LKPLYHLTIPDSPRATSDAVVQEVNALRARHSSAPVIHLYPGRRPGTRFPRRWWGLQKWPRIRRWEREIDLHHIFNPDPYPFALLPLLRRPVLYTAVAGIGGAPRQQVARLAAQVHTLVLPTASDREQAADWGIRNVRMLGPIFDPHRFQFQTPPAAPPFVLLMASAPWTESQFQSKGVDALLAAARQDPDLHLIFLWRGVLLAEMQARVARAGLQRQVHVIDTQVDVNEVLAGVHATVLLVTDCRLIKAHPHSLLESLFAGKPVLVSERLPMARWVREAGCGVVVDAVSGAGVAQGIAALRAGYPAYQRVAQTAVRDHFPSPIPAYQTLYAEAVKNG
jgi:glycosyltransferase involved in cell wall biosynthesis